MDISGVESCRILKESTNSACHSIESCCTASELTLSSRGVESR